MPGISCSVTVIRELAICGNDALGQDEARMAVLFGI
jgi:hypothetical protein